MRVFVFLFLAALTAACTSSAAYEDLLNTWIGATEDQLLKAWGAPESFYETDDFTYLTYENESLGYVPPPPPIYVPGPNGPRPYYRRSLGGGYNYTISCRTTFVVNQNGLVESARWEGNGCRA